MSALSPTLPALHTGTWFPSVAGARGVSAARRPRAAFAGDGGKLPEITLAFWLMKIAATTLGETGGDLFSMTMGLGYTASSLILVAILAVALASQMASRRYRPTLYWSVILLTSTAGTTLSDFTDRTLALGYVRGSALLLTLLAAVFALWRASGESFSVSKIRTRRVEALYWSAILVSNTLGTALGDFLAHSSGLGFAGGALAVGSVLAAITLAAFLTNVPKVLLFWLAFVLTRPFGATLGDVLTKSHAEGGLGFGTVGASAVLAGILVLLVVHASTARGARK